MKQRCLRIQDYMVGWVCALPIKLAAAAEMLDEEHQHLPTDANDTLLLPPLQGTLFICPICPASFWSADGTGAACALCKVVSLSGSSREGSCVNVGCCCCREQTHQEEGNKLYPLPGLPLGLPQPCLLDQSYFGVLQISVARLRVHSTGSSPVRQVHLESCTFDRFESPFDRSTSESCRWSQP